MSLFQIDRRMKQEKALLDSLQIKQFVCVKLTNNGDPNDAAAAANEEGEELSLKNSICKLANLFEPQIDLSRPNVTTIKQRPVDMGETIRYRCKNSEEIEKRRTYCCKYEGCRKSYTKSSHLKVHTHIHTGEKPYHCKWPYCKWKFAKSVVI